MSHLLRCGLVAAGLVLAFAAGFYVKPVPALPTVAAQPAPAPIVAPPIVDPDVKPATALVPPPPAHPEPDPLDAAGMAMIRQELGHKTTILDKNEPVPAVLKEARRRKLQEEENSPQVCGPVFPLPQLPPPVAPQPMGGSMPRLEPPPALAAPMIDHAPIQRPDMPPGTTMRITIRDPAGTVMTVTTSGRVTIELVAPDAPPPGSNPGPMPRELGAAAVPEPLRSLLPILLGSPSFFPPVAWAWPLNEPEPGMQWAVDTARQFTDAPVVEVEPVESFVRRQPVAMPPVSELLPPEVEWLLAIMGHPICIYNPDDTEVWYESPESTFTGWGEGRARMGPERFRRFECTRLARQRDRLAVDVRDGLTAGQSILRLLIDPGWKPTTATPESCRWEYELAPTNFWDTPPLGVRLDL